MTTIIKKKKKKKTKEVSILSHYHEFVIQKIITITATTTMKTTMETTMETTTIAKDNDIMNWIETHEEDFLEEDIEFIRENESYWKQCGINLYYFVKTKNFVLFPDMLRICYILMIKFLLDIADNCLFYHEKEDGTEKELRILREINWNLIPFL